MGLLQATLAHLLTRAHRRIRPHRLHSEDRLFPLDRLLNLLLLLRKHHGPLLEALTLMRFHNVHRGKATQGLIPIESRVRVFSSW